MSVENKPLPAPDNALRAVEKVIDQRKTQYALNKQIKQLMQGEKESYKQVAEWLEKALQEEGKYGEVIVDFINQVSQGGDPERAIKGATEWMDAAKQNKNNGFEELKELIALIDKSSYVAGLMAAGEERIKRKIGEEAVEVLLCAPGEKPSLRAEITDLWFHCLVLMSYNGIALEEIYEEFSKRLNTSGLREKASREPGKPAS